MPKAKLTLERIREFSCPEGKSQAFLWDETVVGLGVRATPSGSKTYIYQDRLGGSTLRVKIGSCSAWLLDNKDPEAPGARQEARRLAALVARGIDPRLHKKEQVEKTKKKQQEARREELTLGDVWPEYIKDRSPFWGERHLLDHQRLTQPGGDQRKKGKAKKKPGPLVKLMPVKLTELTPSVVREWVVQEAKTRPTAARQAFEALRTFANWCEEGEEYKGLIPEGAFNGRVKEALPKKAAKSDTLEREQLKAWFEAVRGLKNPVMSAYLQALLLTGARRGELASLTWENVNFKWQALTIHDKVEGERTIPLTPYLSTLLASLPRRNEFVFSSPKSTTGHVEDPRRHHNRALAVAGLEGLTIHGLRRSFSNLSEWVETPVGIVYQLMGHRPSATAEKHYKRRPLDLLRMWHTKIEAWILDQAGIEQPDAASGSGESKIVPIREGIQ